MKAAVKSDWVVYKFEAADMVRDANGRKHWYHRGK